jgi:glutathione S-transferase
LAISVAVAIQNALRFREIKDSAQQLQTQLGILRGTNLRRDRFTEIIGVSSSMTEVFKNRRFSRETGIRHYLQKDRTMSSVKLFHMYASPWAERVRWALNYKGVPYEKEDYRPGVDEEKIKKLTGQAQVPVLMVDGTAIPDSTAILNWLEQYKPQPSLMPTAGKDRAHVMMWEELMDGVLGPQARILIIGHFLRSSEPELQQVGCYFAQKYQHSAYAEEHARFAIERILTILTYALEGRQYLVGHSFTRADMTAASMLLLVNPPSDELFVFPTAMRPKYTVPLTSDPRFAPIFAWRDKMYRKHRGETVKP